MIQVLPPFKVVDGGPSVKGEGGGKTIPTRTDPTRGSADLKRFSSHFVTMRTYPGLESPLSKMVIEMAAYDPCGQHELAFTPLKGPKMLKYTEILTNSALWKTFQDLNNCERFNRSKTSGDQQSIADRTSILKTVDGSKLTGGQDCHRHRFLTRES